MPYYSNCSTLNALGTCFLYTDPALINIAPAGKYSNGSNCYTVNTSGLITAVDSCAPSITITVYYSDTGGCSGDSIVVTKNGATVANLSSNGNTSFSAVAADSIIATVTPGTGGVSCNFANVYANDSAGTFAFSDNGGSGNAQITFTVGTGNSGNINIYGTVGPQQ